ncbi:hypothetical protein JCM14469_07220 [Desulfatiferula olefinivorans]
MVHRLKGMLCEITGDARGVARGIAVGVFVGLTPFFGLHVLMSLALVRLIRGRFTAALIGIQITNVFTAPFVYALTFKVGSLFYGKGIRFDVSHMFSMDTVRDVTVILSIGGLVIGLPTALIVYRCVMMMFRSAQGHVGG